jgi:YidC/Oxa1 family membrane protein insertase
MWSAIVNGMTKLFMWIHSLIITLGVPKEKEGLSYVLAIFLLTAIIRILILPLNIKSTKSNAKMQEIQPEMKKLQAKYANDPQKLQLETSKLMKENNVSMFGGCLPSLLPLPILFALYYVFRNITPTPGADTSFLGIQNIFIMPESRFTIQSIILAILAALSTYIPSLLLSKSMPTQEGGMNMGSMNLMMAGMMGFMSLQFQPMLVIYWIIGGLIQLVQTYFLNYIPAKRKEMLKQENTYQVDKVESTPKTKKR